MTVSFSIGSVEAVSSVPHANGRSANRFSERFSRKRTCPVRTWRGRIVLALAALGSLISAVPARAFDLTPPPDPPRLRRLERALRAPRPELRAADALRGLAFVYDGVPPVGFERAVARSALRANPLLDPLDAIAYATDALDAARRHGLDPAFFAGLLLQESAFDPGALSDAGAVGIAQFTFGTALAHGVADPFDPAQAIPGAAALLGGYVRAYAGRYADPYAVAAAAYNAGPGAVARYRGVPPYAETRAYVDDVEDRAARILRDAGARRR